MSLPNSIYQLQHLEILNLNECKQVREIFQLPPNIVEVQARECMSLAIFLEEPRRSQSVNTWEPPKPGVRTASLALPLLIVGNNVVIELDFLIQRDCPSSLKVLDLSHSAIVNLPAWLNKFVGLKKLCIVGCSELQEILGLPPNVVEVKANGCESLAKFLEEPRRSQLLNTWNPQQSLSVRNNVKTESNFFIQLDCPSSLKVLDLSRTAIVSLPTWLNRFVGLEELYLNGCKQLEEIPELPPNIKKGHPRDLEFYCIFPGNKIPDCFSHRKEVSNTDWCEIDIEDHVHLDSVN